MDIRLFYEFTMVAKHRNLSEASKELHVTESVLSRHLATIEAELGVEIYDKSKSPMELTPVGREFLEIACRIGNEECRLHDLKKHAALREVQVRVGGTIDGVTLPVLRAAAASLGDEHVTLVFPPTQTHTAFEQLRRRQLDMAVEPLSALADTHDLAWVHVASEPAFVVMDAENPLRARESFFVDDLPDLAFTSLLSNRENAMRKHLQAICQAYGFPGDVPGALVMSSASTYDKLFLTGLGGNVILLPERVALKYSQDYMGLYEMRPLVGDGTAYDFCAFYRAEETGAVRRLAEALDLVGERVGR